MEITQQDQGDRILVEVQGRLDGSWADHLADRLSEVVRSGRHHIRLDLSRTTFLSSAGIRVLLIYFKQLKNLQGGLEVWQPSEMVREVLELSGLQSLLTGTLAIPVAPIPTTVEQVSEFERPKSFVQLFGLSPKATLTCTSLGDPALLAAGAFQEKDCRGLTLRADMFALGLGALGSSFSDCRDRFGEFVGAAGAIACLPGDGGNAPDYSIAAGAFLPEVKMLYGLSCRGSFAYLARFEIKPEARSISLTDIVDGALEASRSSRIGMVMVAETLGLVGASLRRSPAAGNGNSSSMFRHPSVREWLSFTAERAYPQATSLVVGIASRDESGLPAALVRPLAPGGPTLGHFHAAPFTYAPLARGKLELQSSVSELFQHSRLQSVLHLLGDDRGIGGIGQSEFVRGACWFGPIERLENERG
jgi:anti-anti-sigma factor